MHGVPIAELDVDNKLQITINNTQPVVLTDLMSSLLAVAAQFERYIRERSPQAPEACTELLIHEVRKGSIVVDLITHSLPLVPLIWEGGPIHEWVTHIKAMMDWLIGKADKPVERINKTSLKDLSTTVQPVAMDDGSTITITATHGASITNHFTISSGEARRIQARSQAEIEQLDEPDDNVHRKQYMTWYQTRFGEGSATGSKAIIESISKRPIKVVFEDDETKELMSHGDARFDCDWQHLAYLVDVEVQTISGRPRAYKILRYYPDETFDPREED